MLPEDDLGYRGEAQIAEERSDEGGGLRFGRGARGNRAPRAQAFKSVLQSTDDVPADGL